MLEGQMLAENAFARRERIKANRALNPPTAKIEATGGVLHRLRSGFRLAVLLRFPHNCLRLHLLTQQLHDLDRRGAVSGRGLENVLMQLLNVSVKTFRSNAASASDDSSSTPVAGLVISPPLSSYPALQKRYQVRSQIHRPGSDLDRDRAVSLHRPNRQRVRCYPQNSCCFLPAVQTDVHLSLSCSCIPFPFGVDAPCTEWAGVDGYGICGHDDREFRVF